MKTTITHLRRRWAVTLLELLTVVLIISLLATIATGVYTGQTRRAKIAATQDLIRQLELAIARYEVDLGELPPSGSGDFPPVDVTLREDGSGYLQLALVHSMNGNMQAPASTLWDGPYITFQPQNLAELPVGVTEPGLINILDAFGNPIIYVRSQDYFVDSATFNGGTDLFTTTAPVGANPDLPAPNPYVARGETTYNPSTYQLISFGPDNVSFGDVGTFNFRGTAADDVTNFGY
jgi:type II secretory pathway pseudopilin PulG